MGFGSLCHNWHKEKSRRDEASAVETMLPRVAHVAQAAVLGGILAKRGLRKGSLAPSGARAAFCVALVAWGAGPRFGATLILFYIECMHFDALPRALVLHTPNMLDGQLVRGTALCTTAGVLAFPLALFGLQYTKGATTLFLDICHGKLLAETVRTDIA